MKDFQAAGEAFSPLKRTLNFLHFSLILLINFVLLDPDPDSESGSGSTNPIESGSTALVPTIPVLPYKGLPY